MRSPLAVAVVLGLAGNAACARSPEPPVPVDAQAGAVFLAEFSDFQSGVYEFPGNYSYELRELPSRELGEVKVTGVPGQSGAYRVYDVDTIQEMVGKMKTIAAEDANLNEISAPKSAPVESPRHILLFHWGTDAMADIPLFVFHPSSTGHRFIVLDQPYPTDLTFHGVMLWQPEVSFQGLAQAPLMEYLEVDVKSRFCLSNSDFYVNSCEGFPTDPQFLWCCTEKDCSVVDANPDVDKGYFATKPATPARALKCYETKHADVADSKPPSHHLRTAAIATSVVVLALIACCAAWQLVRYLKKNPWLYSSRELPQLPKRPRFSMPKFSFPSFSRSGSQGFYKQEFPETAQKAANGKDGLTAATSMGSAFSSTIDTQPQAPNVLEQHSPLQETLTTLAARRAVVHGTFILHGPPILGTGPDEGSIIQRARRVPLPGADRQGTPQPEFQLKFYSSRNLADHEKEVYADQNLRAAVCPAVTGIFHASKLEAKDAHAEPLSIPTFVAFERTDDLKAWSHLFSCSPLSVARAISQLAGLLEALHERGIVHRNVRPENLRWHSRKLSWSLVNFGISGDVGYPADVKWVGHYTAPEVAVAIEAGTTSMIVNSSLDMWSLGVVAYEILTRAPAFSESLTDQEVQAMLTGKGSLPWENKGAGRNRLKRFAARLKGVVLGCLDRDPNKRVTAKALKGSLQSLLEYGSSSNGTGSLA